MASSRDIDAGLRRTLSVVTLVVLVSAPGLYVLGLGLIQFSAEWWKHLIDTVLPHYLADSAAITLGATLYALLAGSVPAWLTYRYRFPGRAWCVFIQLLPLTIPAYISAGLYLEAFEAEFFASRTALALELGAGAAPLVFLFIRLALSRMPAAPFETAASLGLGAFERFRRVALPILATPLIAAACLVAAEAIGDFGAASRVGVTTLSVGLHQQWHALQKPELATMLALILFLLSALLATPLIRLGINSQRAGPANALRTLAPLPASPIAALGMHLVCLALTLPGFWAPLALAMNWTAEQLGKRDLAPLYGDIGNTLSTALACVIVCLALALTFAFLLGNGERVRRSDRTIWFVAINYLTPSLVLALAWLSFSLSGRWVVIMATSVKLLPLLLLPISDALARLPAAQTDSARSLGSSHLATVRRVVLPQIGPVIAGGTLLVFVLAATELILALTLQPFGYSALSLRIFAYAGINMTQSASVWVICLCLLCLYPVWRLSQLIEPTGNHHA